MTMSQRPEHSIHRTTGSIEETLHAHFVNWRIREASRHHPIAASVVPCSVGDIRIIALSGQPFHAARGAPEIASDGEDYLGILYQRTGSTYCKTGDDARHVQAGDVTIWRCDRPAEFTMPGAYDKLCMMIPATRLESVLHNAASYGGAHLSKLDPLAALLGSYLTTLSQEFVAGHDKPDAGAMDVTLELLAAAFRADRSKNDLAPRQKLLNRILRYIESRLEHSSLTPKAIAEANCISVRYLYLLFSEQGSTVAGWIRERRLARCRAELENKDGSRTIAEIAYQWGFSDSAHFSRLFKAAYGISPKAYRVLSRTN